MSITIDEATLRLLDELSGVSPGGRSRSALVRTAIREFVEREGRRQTEEREREILRNHRQRLGRQVQALLAEQARL
jgi:metal-responsive CopG/Arc/MetJ family transcriptional regulator